MNYAETSQDCLDPSLHWLANYQAELVYLDQKTRLGKTRHFGPLRVQRPFYPEGHQCAHLYLLHPPGGLVAGDYLTISLSLDDGAQALVTTPSAGKIYNNITELNQTQKVRLCIKDQAVLEWMPQETIVFDGAKGELITQVDISGSGIFVGWDIVCLGRPSSEDWFAKGRIEQSLLIRRDAKPVFIERNRIDAAQDIMQLKAGLAGEPVFGCFVISAEEDILNRIVQLNEQDFELLQELAGTGLFAVTQKPGAVVVRYLGACAETAKKVFTHYWALVRPHVNQRGACPPRIWNT